MRTYLVGALSLLALVQIVGFGLHLAMDPHGHVPMIVHFLSNFLDPVVWVIALAVFFTARHFWKTAN